jgi:hypothetical protein
MFTLLSIFWLREYCHNFFKYLLYFLITLSGKLLMYLELIKILLNIFYVINLNIKNCNTNSYY